VKHLSKSILIGIIAILFAAKFPARAASPDIASVPQNIPTAEQAALNKRSVRLHVWHDELKTKAEEFNSRAVPKESGGYAVYQRDKAKLDSEIGMYATAVTKFNEAVAQMAEKWAEPLEAHIQRLHRQIASDQEALRKLGLEKNASDFEEWDKLTDDERAQFLNESMRIWGSLIMDEAAIGLQRGTVRVASKFDEAAANTAIESLRKRDMPTFISKPLFEAITEIAESTSSRGRQDAASKAIAAASGLLKPEADAAMSDYVKKYLKEPSDAKASYNIRKHNVETAFEILSTIAPKGPARWQARAFIATVEECGELGLAFHEQHQAEKAIASLNHMTEEQLKGVKSVSALLKKHVEELKEAKQESN